MDNVIYALYQTDVYKSHNSKVCFGFFEDIEEAKEEAEAHDLIKESEGMGYFAVDEGSIVVIEEHELGKFGSYNGKEIESFEYMEEANEPDETEEGIFGLGFGEKRNSSNNWEEE